MSKCKRWVFTSFNTENEPQYEEARHEYLVYGRETCPDTHRRHLQGFVVFKNRTTLAGAKRWIPQAHFERARGSPAEASEYCKKDGDFMEFGQLPTVSGRASKFGDLLAKAERGEIDALKAEYPGQYIRYKANILSSMQFSTDQLSNSCGVWISGPPRTGKDFSVRKLKSVYIKSLNKWWDGYRNEDNVLISDIEPSHGPWLGYFLKIWADCYPFNAEIKGGSMLIRPKKIFCTSNFSLCDVFTNPQIQEALQARFNTYDVTDKAHPVLHKRVLPRPDYTVARLIAAHEEDVFWQESEKENISPSETFPPQEANQTSTE